LKQAYKGRSTTNLYPANTREVGPRSKGLEGVVWWWGEKGSIFGFQRWLLLEIYPAKMVSYPKKVMDGWDHLMHAIEVGGEIT